MTSTAPSTRRLERSTPSETAIRWPTTELLLSVDRRTLVSNLYRPASQQDSPKLGAPHLITRCAALRPRLLVSTKPSCLDPQPVGWQCATPVWMDSPEVPS